PPRRRERARERFAPSTRRVARRGSRDRRPATGGDPPQHVRQVARVWRAQRAGRMRSRISRTVRALPTLLRIGVAETIAYRGEFLVWMLTTTMPLVMLGLWTAVADEGPFRQFSSNDFVAYYLAMLIVRN